MPGIKLALALLVTGSTVFAQHGGAFRGGSGRAGAPVLAAPSPIRSPRLGVFRATNRVLGRGRNRFAYGWPYFPEWDYDLAPPYYGDDFANGYPEYPLVEAPVFPLPAPSATAPVKPAYSVIHEYNFAMPPVGETEESLAFTIVLKDGSRRTARASWVADRELHYIDLESRPHALAPELIDRNATEQANRQKNLSLELPPG